MQIEINKEIKETIKKFLDIAERTYYNWRKEGKPIIFLLEKYFTKEDLEEFLETSMIERLEPSKKDALLLIEKLKQYYKVGTDKELGDRINVAQTTISGWKQRNSVSAIRRKIYELGLNIDLDKKNYSSHKITEMEERISFLESIILEQNHINEETMAEYANVPIETIQDWKINKPELIATIIQSLIKKGEKQ